MAVTPDLVVLRALGLGDLLTGVPALRALAREVPGRRLLLTPQALAPIAEPLGYEVLDLHGVSNVPHALPAEAAGTALAVNLHGRGPESHAVLADLQPRRLLAFACGDHDGPVWTRTSTRSRGGAGCWRPRGSTPIRPTSRSMLPRPSPAAHPRRHDRPSRGRVSRALLAGGALGGRHRRGAQRGQAGRDHRRRGRAGARAVDRHARPGSATPTCWQAARP